MKKSNDFDENFKNSVLEGYRFLKNELKPENKSSITFYVVGENDEIITVSISIAGEKGIFFGEDKI